MKINLKREKLKFDIYI